MNNRSRRAKPRQLICFIEIILLLLALQHLHSKSTIESDRTENAEEVIRYKGVSYAPIDLPTHYDRERLASVYNNLVRFEGQYTLSMLEMEPERRKLVDRQQQKAGSDYLTGNFKFSELVQSTYTLFVEKNAYNLREKNILDKIRKSSTLLVSNEFTNFYSICLIIKFKDVNEMNKIPGVTQAPTPYGPSVKDYIRALPPEEILYLMPSDFEGTPDQPTYIRWGQYEYNLSDLTRLIVEYFDQFASIPPHIYRSLRLSDAQMNEFSSVMSEKKRISREFVNIQSEFYTAIDSSFRETNFTECLILIRFFERWFPASAMEHLSGRTSPGRRPLFRYLSDYEARINEIYYSKEELDTALSRLKTNIFH